MMEKNAALFERAQHSIPGGVNSPVRSFNAVGGIPPFIKRGEGAYLYDEEGRRYIDYVGSWGPLILGHADKDVVAAVQAAAAKGLSFGAPTEQEIELAELICSMVPSIEKIRMVNSGTEATMSAIRLARGVTQRPKIIKFIGCYHGHVDALLVKAGSGLLTYSMPNSAGVPEDFTQHTLLADFNDLAQVKQLFAHYGKEIAAIIVEPIPCNMNCILPKPDFLPGLRQLCDTNGSILIFDEVITGFRVGLTGAQGYYHITPDLTTYGKIIGGGMPVGAYGGKRSIMDHVAPLGTVYQAGTLSGNPVAMAAGLATLNKVSTPGFYERLQQKTDYFINGMRDLARKCNISLTINQIGSIFGLFFTERDAIDCYEAVSKCDILRFKRFFHAMLQQGIYLAPSAYEAGFVSSAHRDEDIDETLNCLARVFRTL